MKNKYLTVPFELKEMDEDEEFFTFSGYASTFGNEDLVGDIVVKGAFLKSIKKNPNPPVLFQHSSHSPLGIFTSMKEDDHGLFVEAKLPKSDSFVMERVIPQLKIKSIGKMSIGYIVRDSEWKGDTRILKEVDLIEISLVTFPANPEANITDMKTFEALEEKEQLEFIAELKEYYAEKGGCPLNKIEKSQIDEVKSVRDAEDLLKNVGFSQTASKAMISVIRNHADEEVKTENINSFVKDLASLNK